MNSEKPKIRIKKKPPDPLRSERSLLYILIERNPELAKEIVKRLGNGHKTKSSTNHTLDVV